MTERNRSLTARVIPAFLICLSFFGVAFLVATPSMESIVEEERVTRVQELVVRLEEACRRHHQDTGKLALEYAARDETDQFNARRYHHLSAVQLYTGWKGPYIAMALNLGDNPWGGRIELRDNLSTHPALGFELEGGRLAHERGQYLVLTGVPESSARLVDAALDRALGEGWDARGRVEYVLDDGGTLSILLLALAD